MKKNTLPGSVKNLILLFLKAHYSQLSFTDVSMECLPRSAVKY